LIVEFLPKPVEKFVPHGATHILPFKFGPLFINGGQRRLYIGEVVAYAMVWAVQGNQLLINSAESRAWIPKQRADLFPYHLL
jgi:hypothetical protein